MVRSVAVQGDRRPAESQDRTWPRRAGIVQWLMLAASVVAGVSVTIRPVFREPAPDCAAYAILADVEYPYMLFGNTAFYLVSAFFSVVLNVPAYVGVGLALTSGFALATCSVFLLARRAGLNPYLAIALGFLYAAGPYLCLNLF